MRRFLLLFFLFVAGGARSIAGWTSAPPSSASPNAPYGMTASYSQTATSIAVKIFKNGMEVAASGNGAGAPTYITTPPATYSSTDSGGQSIAYRVEDWSNASGTFRMDGSSAKTTSIPSNTAPTAWLSGPTSLQPGVPGTWTFGVNDTTGNLKRWRFYKSSNPNPQWSNVSGSSTSGSYTESFSSGTCTFLVDVEDLSGASGSAGPLTVTIGKVNQASVGISPSSTSVSIGGSVNFGASGGSGTGAYIWGGSASGSGSSKSVTFNSAGTQSVSVYRAGDSTYNDSNTAVATVSVNKLNQSSVSISPTAQTITLGQTVTFTVSGGSGSGSYHWGGAASGAGNSKAVTFHTAGTQSVTVYRAGDSNYAPSNTATASITVGVSPAITAQPQAVAVTRGETATFTVNATGGSLIYQWRKNGINIAGATGYTLTITDAVKDDVGSYDVFVYNNYGTVTSQPATLTVNEPPLVLAASATVVSPSHIRITANLSDFDGDLQRADVYLLGWSDVYTSWNLMESVGIGGYQATAILEYEPSQPFFPGTYYLWIRAVDSYGAQDSNGGVLVSFIVEGSSAPSMTASPLYIAPGDPVTVDYDNAPVNSWLGLFQGYTNNPGAALLTIPLPDGGNGQVPFTGTASLPDDSDFVVKMYVGTAWKSETNFFYTTTHWGLTVVDGRGGVSSAPVGAHIKIQANPSPPGEGFVGWSKIDSNMPGTIVSPDPDYPNDPDRAVFVMGKGYAAIRANYSGIPQISSSATASGQIGQSFSYTLTATNSPTSFTVSGLPAGLGYQLLQNPARIAITGIPQVYGEFDIPVSASNAAGTGYGLLTFNIAGGSPDAAPAIVLQPQGLTVTTGNAFSLSVAATGSPSPTFQWHRNGVAISGATASMLVRNSAGEADAGTYSVVVSNRAGSVTSAPAVVKVRSVYGGFPWGTVSPDANPGAPSSISGVGTLGGDLVVDNKGSANYSLPLQIPPGRGGMEPKLALAYSSDSGNGPLGVGFGLSTGFPQAITRGRSILARDGEVRGVNFDARDKFYLDGRRLICVDGTYGAPGSTYRTEVDSFVTIVASGTGTDESSWNIDTFTVTDKTGVKTVFGKYGTTSDGYQRAAGSAETRAATWAVKHVEDTLGNSVDFIYTDVTNDAGFRYGEYVLSRIEYTGSPALARVTFLYNIQAVGGSVDRRDRNVTYQAGRAFAHSRRLDAINVEYNDGSGYSRVGYYSLGYEYAARQGRLRLTSVKPYLFDVSAGGFRNLPATAFHWSNSEASFTTTDPAVRGSSSTYSGYFDPVMPEHYAFGDVDGDGKDDCVWFGGGLSVGLSSGTDIGPAEGWSGTYLNNVGVDLTLWKLADVNGDGRKDVICGGIDGGNKLRLFCMVSTGDSFVPLAGGASATPIYTGSTDIHCVGSGGLTPDWGSNAAERTGVISQRIATGDFTGDGRDDVLIHRMDGQLNLLKNEGDTFVSIMRDIGASSVYIANIFATWDWPGYWIGSRQLGRSVSMMPCDLNGDGLLDYVWSETDFGGEQTPHFAASGFQMFFAVTSLPGGGFSPKTSILGNEWTLNMWRDVPGVFRTPGGWMHRESMFAVMPGDVNGDGLTDFTILSRESGMSGPVAGHPDYTEIYPKAIVALSKGVAGTPQFEVIYPDPALGVTVNVGGEQVFPWFDKIAFSEWQAGFTISNLASSFLDKQQVVNALGSSCVDGIGLCDVNLDGRDDYVWYVTNPTQAGWWVIYSLDRGNALPERAPLGWLPPQQITRDTQYNGVTRSSRQALDLNGDGIKDYAYAEHSVRDSPNFVGFHLSSAPRGDKLTVVTDGLGSRTEIAYKPITDDSIYTEGAPVSYPVRELRNANYVVSDVYKDSGGGDPAHFSYQYSGNRLDLSGRGSLGFHSFVVLDRQTNVFKYQFFAQSFPMTGLTHREETYRYLGPNSFNIVSSKDNTVVFDKVATSGGATLWPFISKAIESRWEDGAGQLTPAGTGTSSSPDSNPENLFKLAKPAGAHIAITAESRFDNQTAAQTTLPGSSGYHASDVDGSSNVVKGAADQTAFNALLATFNSATYGKITHGNLTQLRTNYGGGYTETVDTVYEPVTANGIANRVQTATTTVASPSYGTEAAPVKSYTYWSNGATPTPLVKTETIDAAGSALDSTTTYARDTRGRVTSTTVTGTDLLAQGAGAQSIITYEATEFDESLDLPTLEKNAYGHPTTTAYHPLLGRPISVSDVNGAEVTTKYDALGRVVQVKDVLKNLTSDTAFVADASQTVSPPSGVTGLTLTSAYRVSSTTTVKPAVTTYHDRLGRAIRVVKGNFNGSTIVDTVYNVLGQVVAVSNPYPAGGTKYWTKTTYDDLGRIKTVTAPNGTVTTHTYNGRVTSVEVDATDVDGPQINTTLVDAKGRTVKVWNADNPAGDVSGVTGEDGNVASVAFALDGFGRMRETTLKGQSQKITAAYDALGQQTELNDPDKGLWKYTNSPLGHVLKQTDARQNVTSTTYDALGRPLIRTTAEASSGPVETAKWFYYDTAANEADAAKQVVSFTTKGWIGALQRQESATVGAPGYAGGNAGANSQTKKIYYYNAKGLPRSELTTIDGRWFHTYTGYDDYSRVSHVRHYWRPAALEAPHQSPFVWEDFGYTYHYDAKSYLLRIDDTHKNANGQDAPRTWWEVDASAGYDHLDRPVLVRKGSGHWTHRSYRETDGALTSIATGPIAGSASIQNLTFNFDGLGNLTERAGSGGSETYGYDVLNRLTTRNGATIASYDPNGNIASKISVTGAASGAYDYTHPNKPHAVTSAFGYTMGYDANGNLDSREGPAEEWAFRYAGFDKPRWMAKTITHPDQTKTTVGSEFLYNANRSRTVQLEFDEMSGGVPSRYMRKRIYGLGSTLEANYETATPSASPAWKLKKVRIYVPGPDGIIGAREFDTAVPSGGTEKALIYHHDHLGSVESITPFGSTSVAYASDLDGKPGRFSADGWGQRRNPFTWNGAPVTTGNNKSDDGGADSLTPRGFTGHEMHDDLGLVNMNGRIYDPLLARFLSADILVQNPANRQCFNRYSYVLNNPLSLTDPSGFVTEDEREAALDKYKAGLQNIANNNNLTISVSQGKDGSIRINVAQKPEQAASGISSVSADRAQPSGTPVKEKVDGQAVTSSGTKGEVKTNTAPSSETKQSSAQNNSGDPSPTWGNAMDEALRLRKANPDAPYIPAPKRLIGSPNYYVFRWYAAPTEYQNGKGPEYLFGFGLKNIYKFNASAEGASDRYKSFVSRTGRELQLGLEDALRADPSIALSRERLLAAAYDSHDGAYRRGGFGELSFAEQVKAAWIPDFSDSLFGGMKAYREYYQSLDLIRWDQISPPPQNRFGGPGPTGF